jgi:hypothetical protein
LPNGINIDKESHYTYNAGVTEKAINLIAFLETGVWAGDESDMVADITRWFFYPACC